MSRVFVLTSLLMAALYAVPSQKVNVVSGIRAGRGILFGSRQDLLLPQAVEPPPKLFPWAVNDVTGLSPVPPGVADTLGYRSVIDGDAGWERCARAPLPCTPYRPRADVRLRKPAEGIAGGFVHTPLVDDPAAFDRGRAR